METNRCAEKFNRKNWICFPSHLKVSCQPEHPLSLSAILLCINSGLVQSPNVR